MMGGGPSRSKERQRNQGQGSTISNINIDDFDDEINGINLSKLFSIYGPNSVEQRKYQRRSTVTGAEHPQSGLRCGNRTGRSTAGGAGGGLRKSQQKESMQMFNANGELVDREKSPLGNSQNDDSIVIKLLSSIFT